MPADMAIDVMMIGRARLRPASIMALDPLHPVPLHLDGESTSRMAFFVTMPSA